MLVGRDAEVEALERALTAARNGTSQAFLLHGEAGVGKSSLLAYAVSQAEDMTVLRATGTLAESELPFAALHQLLRPLLGHIEQLPKPQAAALAGAFGLSTEPVIDRFHVALAVLGLLADATEEAPVLCVVDDVQWLDQASADALLFAARRFEAERIAVVFAARDDPAKPFAAPGLPELLVGPLNPDASLALVLERLGGRTTAPVVEWLLETARGNPLALLELPEALNDEQLSGREPLARALPVASSVERAYLDRVGRLPELTRRLLLLAACEGAGDRATVARGATSLGLPLAELASAEADALVRVSQDRIEFHHPLVRSAVYNGATAADREASHRALAAVLADEGDEDRRAWHLAAAAVGLDDEVADELERTAQRAIHRAGYSAASAALERASELTTDRIVAGRRLVEAAHLAGVAGRVRRSTALAERAEPLVDDPLQRADLARIKGMAQMLGGRPALAADLLSSGAEAAAEVDSARALELMSAAFQAAALSGDAARFARVVEDAKAIRPDPDDPRQVALSMMLDGGSRIFGGDVDGGAPLLEEGLLRAAEIGVPGDLVLAAIASNVLGNDARARELYLRAEAAGRATGALSIVVFSLTGQCAQNLLDRRLQEAAAQAEDVVRLSRELGMENPGLRAEAVLAWIAAFQGREEECRRRAEHVLAVSATRGLAMPSATATWALAELDLGLGQWESALMGLEQLAIVRPGFGNAIMAIHSTPDRTEAAVRAGRPELAQATLDGFANWVESTSAPWALPLLARCRGLLETDPERAAEHFEEALRLHESGGTPFDRARTELVYGELLRRERRRLEARSHLRSALATFEQHGAVFWAERASGELRATGETARRGGLGAIAQLTPQELQIAQLVGEGRSNKEVAAQLYLSPRTVEYHLRKVFTKLGISSRSELIRAGLDGAAVPDPVLT